MMHKSKEMTSMSLSGREKTLFKTSLYILIMGYSNKYFIFSGLGGFGGLIQ
jgi:hypothetical protein